MLSNILTYFRLKYKDPLQEKEYHQLKGPLLQDSLKWLFVFTALLFVPLTFRYFSKHLVPQNYLGIAFIAVAVVAFLARNKIKRWLETLSFVYVALMLILYIINMRLVLIKQAPYEAFYMGYGFALIQRMLDYRVSNYWIATVFHLTFIVVKFTLVAIPDVALAGLVVCVEIFPLILGFKSEQSGRAVFDSLYKSKQQLVKFKQFITEYLPNQMAILSANYTKSLFINDSFRAVFSSGNFEQMKNSLQGLTIDHESVEKNREVFDQLGVKEDEEMHIITLSRLLEIIANKFRELKEIKVLRIQVFRHDSVRKESFSPRSNHNMYMKKPSREINSQTDEQNGYHTDRVITVSDRLLKENHKTEVHQEQAPSYGDQELEEPEGQSRRDSSRHSQKKVWNVTLFPITWDQNEAIAVILDDITHEKTIMELRVADKNRKDMVVAMISHELRTPLNGLLGMIEIVKKRLCVIGGIGDSDVFSYLEACKSNSLLLLNLVNSIVDFSQIKSDRQLRLDYSRVNILELLMNIKPLFEHFCRTKNLNFNLQIDPSVPEIILTDQNRLSQILVSLIGNAFKFTFKGEVTVRVAVESPKTPKKIRFSVEDTGIGINEVDRERLFRLFGGAEQQERMFNTHGMGLGLTISNTLARMLGPSQKRGIEVQSECGKGSVFSFLVLDHMSKVESEKAWTEDYSCDAIEEQRDFMSVNDRMVAYSHEGIKDRINLDTSPYLLMSKPGTSEEVFEKDDGEKETDKSWCLLVDDNPFNLMVAQHVMEERGYETKSAMNGKEAIEKVEEHQKNGKTFKVILMDCQMPVMDGYEATRILNTMMKEGKVNKCPIIALTANAKDEKHDKLSEEVGMNGYIAKPLQVDKLEKALHEIQKKEKELNEVRKIQLIREKRRITSEGSQTRLIKTE